MPIDLHATLVTSIAATLADWLSERGVSEPPPLGPPTRAGNADLALPCHKYARAFRKAPQAIAEDLAAVALEHELVASAEALNGFLNLTYDWSVVSARLVEWALADAGAIGRSTVMAGQRVLIEYSSPNTNKPQHLGHCRNNLLGHTCGSLLEAAGADVVRVNLVNDRGIHICKSMVAYQRFGEGATPESTGVKGDHLVGQYYVKFNDTLTAEYAAAFPNDDGPGKEAFFNDGSDIGAAAKQMLQDWEAGDDDVRALWTTMNGWCEAGFDQTYERMGVRFDVVNKESQTYQLGRSIVEDGLASGVFHRAENGAAVFDQAKIGLEGEKAVLRADGTSLYVTQDLGTAVTRFTELAPDRMVYVVGNEQDHYFRVLFGILGHVRPELKGRLVHRSYGMVELPTGKMKSREGTVVDADQLMDELHAMVLNASQERWADLSESERVSRAEAIGLGGLKYFLLKYNPDRTFIFDKESSISIEGETGPYCQYAHARADSILRKLGEVAEPAAPDWTALDEPHARAVMTTMLAFPRAVRTGAQDLDPSLPAKATYDLAKAFASFYNHPGSRVLGATPPVAAARAKLVAATRRVLAAGLALMGMVPLDEM
jgi:arginyl-tRNA synthetase